MSNLEGNVGASTIHPVMRRTLTPEDARAEYEQWFAACKWSIRPSFEYWWYMQETRHEDKNGDLLGHLHPGHHELNFEQWKLIRGVASMETQKETAE